MIQFNLLPDIKLEYLRAERTRRLVISVSVLVSLASIVLFGILLSITTLQHKHINDLSKDIKTDSATIQNQPDLNKILTVQNQLESLTGLHADKAATSRLSDYLTEITPAQANIDNLAVDFNADTITITGTADSLSTVNEYVDTLKFTTYSSTDGTKNQTAFSDVVLSSFGLTEHEADYTINLDYDPAIFDITQTVTLTVPKQVTTRSELGQPTDLFKLPIDTPSTTGASR